MRKVKRHPSATFYLFFALLFLGISIAGINSVFASLKDSDAATNDLQISDLTGTIDEEFIPPTIEEPAGPGDSYSKKVTIKNESTTDFFVRVLVTPEIQSKEGLLLASGIGKELEVDIQPDWLLGEDGYYYYLGKVAKGKETTPLFTTVSLSSKLAEKYKESALTIQIKSETVGSAAYLYRNAWWADQAVTETNVTIVDNTLKDLTD